MSEELLKDLGELYGRLNHGDDNALLEIMLKHGYDVVYGEQGYCFEKASVDATESEANDD